MQRTTQLLTRLWAAALVLGLIGLGLRLFTGERLVGYGSYVPWGLWVAIYFHAVGIAGGVFVVGTIGYFRRVPVLRDHLPVVIWTSLVALATGLLAIGLDLGQPMRAYRMLTSPNFGSMMAFNSWMYGVFAAVAVICFWLLRRPPGPASDAARSWLVPLLGFGIVLGLAFPSQSGVFFGVVEAKPYWSNPLLPILFLAGAIASGAAVLLLIMTFLRADSANLNDEPFRYLRWVTAGAVFVYFALEFAKMSTGLWSPTSHSQEPISLVLFGPFWWVFWVVHLGGGLAALWLLARGRTVDAVGTGAFLVALTFISGRLNVLIPGQSIPELEGLRQAFTHEKLSFYYQATITEYLVALFLGAFGVGLVYLGLKRFAGFTLRRRKAVS